MKAFCEIEITSSLQFAADEDRKRLDLFATDLSGKRGREFREILGCFIMIQKTDPTI